MMTMGESTWMVFILSFCLLPCVMCANCIKDISSIAEMLETEVCSSISAKPYFSHIYYKDAELYIGSSNSLYHVNATSFTVLSKQCIDPYIDPNSNSIPCTDIVPANDIPFVCQNQISVIEKFGDVDWLVCGTNSLKPACWKCDSNNTIWSCSMTSYDANVERFAPRRPDHDSTWYYNRTSGLIFAGTEVKVHKMPYFSRLNSNYEGADFLNQLSYTKANHENWLNTPAFVGKPIHMGEYIYFFFRETATEYKNAGKIIYPRVGRVCAQNDAAGKVDRLGNYFQTFVKARLNCSIALDFPFYFNEIQDIYFEGDTPDIVYAVFTTPSEGPPASAVCAYSMTEIEELFDVIGKYKGQSSSDADWLPSSYDQLGAGERFGTCGHRYNLDVIDHLDSHNLIDQLVPNLRNVKVPHVPNGRLRESDSPLLYYNTYRFSSIVKVDEGGLTDPIVFMIGTSNMKILKAAYNPSMGEDEYGTIITEIMMNETQNVQDMIKVSDANGIHVIVTAISDVFKLRVEFCDVYSTCEECLRVKDPHCQWSKISHSCYYNGYLVSSHPTVHESCVISRGSDDIDQVKSFRDSQHYSSKMNHSLNLYALLVAEKGSNIQVDLGRVNRTMWNCQVSKGVTSNTEFSALRLTLQNGGGEESLQNVSIPIQSDANESHMSLETSVILDGSEIPSNDKITKRIFDYDSDLARYEYSVKQIRQKILQTCSESKGNGNNVLTCPGYRFQEDKDSFTCPKKALF